MTGTHRSIVRCLGGRGGLAQTGACLALWPDLGCAGEHWAGEGVVV